LSVVTVRISDEEKERIDEIMRNLQISRYSDVMRMALHMLKQHDFSRFTQAHSL
jgi:predicted transcriptional regulator